MNRMKIKPCLLLLLHSAIVLFFFSDSLYAKTTPVKQTKSITKYRKTVTKISKSGEKSEPKSKYIIGGDWKPMFKESISFTSDVFGDTEVNLTRKAFNPIMKSGGIYFDYIMPNKIGFGIGVSYKKIDGNYSTSDPLEDDNDDGAFGIRRVPIDEFSKSNDVSNADSSISQEIQGMIICAKQGDTNLVSGEKFAEYDPTIYADYLKIKNTKITDNSLIGVEESEFEEKFYFQDGATGDVASVDLGYVYHNSKQLNLNFRVLYDFVISKELDVFIVGKVNWMPVLSDVWSPIKLVYQYTDGTHVDSVGYNDINEQTAKFSNAFGMGADVTARYNFGSFGLVGGLGIDKQFTKKITGDKSPVPAINDGENTGVGTTAEDSLSRSGYSINGIVGISFSF